MLNFSFVKMYVEALVGLLVIDGIWLGLVAKNWYSSALGPMMRSQVNFWAAGAFYLLYTFGLVYLVLQPAFKNQAAAPTVFITGLILGMVAYGTYDLTNLTVLKNWPLMLSLVDIIWGGVLTATVSWLVFKLS